MNAIPKAVFSHRSLEELTRDAGKRSPEVEAQMKGKPQADPTPAVLEGWRNPRVLAGPLADELKRLKAESGKDVIVYGGAKLSASVIASGLLDELYLLVHPVVLGGGLPIFTKVETQAELELVYAKPFPGGTVGHLYRPKKR